MVYHSVVLEGPPLPLQPFAQTVTLHVRLFPVQWHLKVPGTRPRMTEARKMCFSWLIIDVQAKSGGCIR
jgi:hypothetical protein